MDAIAVLGRFSAKITELESKDPPKRRIHEASTSSISTASGFARSAVLHPSAAATARASTCRERRCS
jgi:hypothetical protein